MRFHAGSLAASCLRLALGGAAVSTLVLSPPAQAQTAADKGTARKLALEGIDLFKAGKYADALERLQRAQDLYDAPVHLIYIARCQAKLGLFVEAAENYRRLVRTDLPGGAPQAFKDAVEDAKKELPSVEPKIAQLKIDVEPKGVKGIKVTVDDTAVSAAAVGVERPTNPGSRKVTVSAPGYKEASTTVELKPGESKSVALTLEVDPNAQPEGGGEGTGGEGGTGAGEGGKGGGPTQPEKPKGPIGFIVGLRVGGMLGAGDLAKDQPMKDYFPSAGSGELRAGIRFMQHYSLLLFGSASSFQPGSRFEKGPAGSTIQVTPIGSSAGVGFMYAPKPGKLGPFGELDFIFVHRLEAKREVDLASKALCAQTLTASGNGIRLGGGVQVPLTSWLQLSPYTTLTFGTAHEFNLDSECDPADDPETVKETPWATTGDAGDRKATHVLIGLGIGGDFMIGGDL